MAELNVGTVVADLELRDKQFQAACGAATAALGSVERAGEAAGASIGPAMAPAATALAHTAEEAQRASTALMAMSATPVERVAMAAAAAQGEIARLEAISGDAAAAERARAAVAERASTQIAALRAREAAAAQAAADAVTMGAAREAAALAEVAKEEQRVAAEAAQANAALKAMSATPMQAIATAANEAAAEIARLEAVSGNTAAAEAARGALAQRTAAAMGAVGKKTAEAGKATANWGNLATQSFYQVSDAASQLSAGTPFTTVLIQQGGQLLPVLASVSSALLGLLPILAPIGGALGLVALGYYNVSKEAAKADAAVEQSRKTLLMWQEAVKPLIAAQDELKLKLKLATGEITKADYAAMKAAESYREAGKATLDAAQKKIAETAALRDAYAAQVYANAGSRDAAELTLIQSKEYGKLTARLKAAEDAYRVQSDAIEEAASTAAMLAEYEVLEAEAASKATSARKSHSKALKDSAAAAKEAAAALRAFVALYEQAADAVYARKEVPGADLFARAQKMIEEVVPPKALSAMERFDLLAADIAAQFSRGLINADQFAQLESMLSSGKAAKFGIDIGAAMAEQAALLREQQAEAARVIQDFVSSLGSKLAGSMGKLGSMITSVVQGAQTGGIWGALVAGLVELLGSSLKLERAVAHVDEWFSRAAEAFGPLIDVVHLLVANVLEALIPVFQGLTPIMQALADVITPLAPLFVLLGSMLQILQPILEFVAATLQPFAMVMDVVGRGLFEIVKVLQLGVGYVVYGISKAYNWIVSQLQKLLDALGVEFDIPKIKTGDMLDSLQALAGETYESAMAQAEQNAAITESTEGFEKLNESLSNVPSGFKVAQKAFEAAAAAIYVGGVGKGGGYVTPADGLGYGSRQTVSFGGGAQTYIPGADRGGSGVTIYIDRLEVRADDADSLVQQLADIAGRKLFARTGSTVGSGLPFASMQVP